MLVPWKPQQGHFSSILRSLHQSSSHVQSRHDELSKMFRLSLPLKNRLQRRNIRYAGGHEMMLKLSSLQQSWNVGSERFTEHSLHTLSFFRRLVSVSKSRDSTTMQLEWTEYRTRSTLALLWKLNNVKAVRFDCSAHFEILVRQPSSVRHINKTVHPPTMNLITIRPEAGTFHNGFVPDWESGGGVAGSQTELTDLDFYIAIHHITGERKIL